MKEKPSIPFGKKSNSSLVAKSVPLVLSVICLVVLVGIATVLVSINSELKASNQWQEKNYLAQLEADKRYDRVADSMKQLHYSEKEVAQMYLDNNEYVSAVKEEPNMLPKVFEKLQQEEPKKQQETLQHIQKIDTLDKKQQATLSVEIALLTKDTNKVKEQEKNIHEQEIADKVLSFFIQAKDYSEAEKLLKDFPNKNLSKQLKQEQLDSVIAEETEKSQQLGKSIEQKNNQISDLEKQLNNIKSKKDDKDKDKKAKEKEKEISDTKNAKSELEKQQKEVDEQLNRDKSLKEK